MRSKRPNTCLMAILVAPFALLLFPLDRSVKLMRIGLTEIPEGHVAVSLSVPRKDLPKNIANLEHAQVDISVRYLAPNGSVRKTIVNNATILGIGGCRLRDGTWNDDTEMITFAVPEEKVLDLALAKELGSVHLSSSFVERHCDPAFWWGFVTSWAAR